MSDRHATLEVDTTQAGRGRARVGYLKTYSSHAVARLDCVAPCSCTSSNITAYTRTRTSTIEFTKWVAFSSPEACVLRLQLKTHSESFKFSALQVIGTELRKGGKLSFEQSAEDDGDEEAIQ